jgi:nucleoid-associated protein YgaU
VEIGGINLNLYNRVTLLVDGQEFTVSNAVISANRIIFTMPDLGTGVLTGAQVQVRLSSATGQPASITFSQTLFYSSPASMAPAGGEEETTDEEEGEADLETEDSSASEGTEEEGEADLEAEADAGTDTEAETEADTEEESSSSAASSSAASNKTIQALRDEVKALEKRVGDLSASLSGQASTAQLTEARAQIAGLTAEVIRLSQLVSSLRSGQVRAFATVDQMAQGLQMPAGYGASGGLQMPAGYPASQGYTAPANTLAKGNYTVKKGDSLWSIAKRYYGDGKKWRKILEANPQALSRPGNPKTLKVGVVLVIPEL